MSTEITSRRSHRTRRRSLYVPAAGFVCAVLATLAVAVQPAGATVASQPGRSALAAQASTLTSTVWGGQVATNGGGFKQVTSWWTVPSVTCYSGEYGTTYAWVGLGGWAGKQALEQVGTGQWCNNGTANYGLFAEFYSSPPIAGDGYPYQPTRYPVRAGDRIYAEVDQRSGGTYELYAYNQTQGWAYDVTGKSPNYNASTEPGNLSAEVVMEYPYGNSSGYYNPYYNSITFDHISYTGNTSYSTSLINNVPQRGTIETTTTAGTASIKATWAKY